MLVTGASKGAGRAIALSYARAGASGIAVAIGARSELLYLSKELTEAAKESGRCVPHVVAPKLDITDRKSVDVAAEIVRSELQYLDILIDSAGQMEKFSTIVDSDPDAWWNVYKTNLFGAYLVTKAFVPLLEALPKRLGTIVTMSSIGLICTTL